MSIESDTSRCDYTITLILYCRITIKEKLRTAVRIINVKKLDFLTFKCSLDVNKAKFYKAFNCIFGKIRRIAPEEVLFALIKSKCLPILLYGTEACPINSAMRHSLHSPLTESFLKYLVPCLKTRTGIYVGTSA